MEAPRARVLEPDVLHAKLVRAILDRTPLGALPPGFVEGGRRWWIAEFADEATLRHWQPDHAAIARLARASDSLGLCVFARSHKPDYDVAVRAPYWGSRSELIEVLELARRGQISVEIETFSLDEAPRAYQLLHDGKVRGRAVVVPGG